jgi:hypothetical protein
VTQAPQTIDSTTQVSQTLAQADQTVQEALGRADATVAETLAQTEQTVDEALGRADATVEDTLAQAEQTVDDAVARVDATVEDTLAQAEQTVDDAVARPEATVDDTPAQTDQTVNEAHADGNEIAAAPTGGATEAGEATTGGSPPATAAEPVASPTGGDASPSSESGAAAASETTLPGDLTDSGTPDGLLGDLPLWSQPFAESPVAGTPAADPVAAAPLPAPGVGSGLDGIVTTATDPRVMTAAGATVLIGGGLGIWRGGPQLADPSVMFTNFRLLPCLIKEGVADHVGTLAAALGRRGPDAAAQIAASPAMVPPQGVAAEAPTLTPLAVGESVGSDGILTRFRGSVHEGFEQGVRGGRQTTDTVADSRVLIQLGMGLGSVYAIFLTVWFWATRLRRSSSA